MEDIITKEEVYFVLMNKINGNSYCDHGYGSFEVDDVAEASRFEDLDDAAEALEFLKEQEPSEPVVIAEVQTVIIHKIKQLR